MKATLKRMALVAVLSLTTAGGATAGRGGPDAGGWAWIDSNEPGIDTAFETPSVLTDIARPLADDATYAVTLSFPFTFYGVTTTTVYLSSNGWISFGGPPASAEPANPGMPDPAGPNAVLAVLWDDLAGGAVTFAQHGPTATGHLIFLRQAMKGSGTLVQTWIQFYNNNTIKVVYVTNPILTSATIGIEDEFGASGTQLARDGVTAPGFAPKSSFAVLYYRAATADCTAAPAVSCPASLSGTTAGGPFAVNTYGCAAGSYIGSEAVYQLNLTGASTLDITLGGFGLRNLDVHLLRAGCETTFGCLAGGADTINLGLVGAGTYYIVVDGRTPADDGPFTLDIACGADISTPIACDGSVSSLGVGANNISTYSCRPGAYTGGEQIYTFSIPTTQSVIATLTPAAPFDLLLLDDVTPGTATCIAGADSVLSSFALPAGSYALVVDGLAGSTGSFRLDLECGDRVATSSCGGTPSGVTAGASLTNTYSCSAESMLGPELYYQVAVPPGTPRLEVVLAAGAPADARVLIAPPGFDPLTSPTCLSAGRRSAAVFSPPAGTYTVIVDSLGGAGPHDLEILCDSRMACGTDIIACGQTVSDTTAGGAELANRYPCRDGEYSGPERIYRFDNPIEQRVTMRLLPGVPGLEVLMLDGCNEALCQNGSGTGGSCLDLPVGTYYVVVDGLDAAQGPFDLTAQCSDFASGSDLVPGALDLAAMIVDPLTLAVSGTVAVTPFNQGAVAVLSAFGVVVFEDVDRSGGWSGPVVDNLLGTASVPSLAAGAGLPLVIPVTGQMQFRDNWVWAVVDDGGVIAESVETNNGAESGATCQGVPVIGSFDVDVEWEWTAREVESAPVVVSLTDDNGDGRIDDLDIPDVVFTAVGNALVALSGDDGRVLWENTTSPVSPTNQVAAADIDGDGLPEIIAFAVGGTGFLRAFEHDGSLKWTSAPGSTFAWGAVSIADLDGDGSPEIIHGRQVYDASGAARCAGTAGNGGVHAMSTVADVDLDGQPEIVAGNTVYRGDCSILWQNPAVADGFPGVANFDSDPNPEIVVVSSGSISLLDHDGTLIWNWRGLSSGGPPTISDVDDDCFPEIGVAFNNFYVMLDAFGVERWRSPTAETSSGVTGSSVFDFDGDGLEEVVYADEQQLRIFSGLDGSLKWSTPNTSWTWCEMAVIADVDGDQHAEILVGANKQPSGTIGNQGMRSIGEPTWVNTRKIWNQHTYHITNIDDDAAVPTTETNNWDVYNNFRTQVGKQVLDANDATASFLRLDCDTADSITATVRLGSAGHIEIPGAVEVAFYDGDPGAGGTLLVTRTIPGPLTPQSWVDVSATLGPPLPSSGFIFAVVEHLDAYTECNEANNVIAAPLPELPIADAGPDLVACVGNDLPVTGTAAPPSGCFGLEYRWRQGPTVVRDWSPDPDYDYPASSPTVLVLEVRCINAPNCVALDSVGIEVEPAPIAAAGPDERVCVDEPLTLDARGSTDPGCPGGLTFTWYQGAVVVGTGPTYVPPTVTPGTTTYTVVASCPALGTCEDADSVDVTVRGGCVLAVDFASFTAAWVANSVRPLVAVRWTTASEEGTVAFVVERAATADGVYVEVGDVITAVGPGHPYERIDDAPPTTGDGPYYRVVELTVDGVGDQTPVVRAERAGRSSSGNGRRRVRAGTVRGR